MLSREFLFGRLVPDANDRRFVQVIAIVALVVRLMLGMTLLTTALSALMGGMNNNFMGPFGGGGMRGSMTGTGVDAVLQAVPYLQLVTGLGLLLGVFTFVWSIVAGLASIIPYGIVCAMLVITAGIAGSPNAFAIMSMLQTTILARGELFAIVLMIFLSHPSINRFSVDTLIYSPQRRMQQQRPRSGFPEGPNFQQEVTEVTQP